MDTTETQAGSSTSPLSSTASVADENNNANNTLGNNLLQYDQVILDQLSQLSSTTQQLNSQLQNFQSQEWNQESSIQQGIQQVLNQQQAIESQLVQLVQVNAAQAAAQQEMVNQIQQIQVRKLFLAPVC
jgi:coproporphyrinogen III oxidase